LAAEGVVALVSGPETVRISCDKGFTHEFFSRCGVACPQQWHGSLARDRADDLPFPVVLKPRMGSSSVGVEVVRDPQMLRLRVSDEDIVQTLAPGSEYTVDVFIDREGRLRSMVPRRRIATRGGEVSKGTVERCPEVEKLARQIVEALPDAFGPLTVQIFRDPQRGCQAIEVNARFGGGYPLSWQAGARTTRWAIQEAAGAPWEPLELSWAPGLTMLRYDQSVFIHGVTT
jgi:carbamoyl-phosphate synthase large subunit